MSLAGGDCEDVSEDALLDGRVRLLQPRAGYRAATDPVLLAAAIPARSGARVLDVGAGVGAAALCLAARVAGLDLHGIEAQPEYAALSARNAARNGAAWTVHLGDVADPPRGLRALSFDHVLTNPPYYAQGAASASPITRKDKAHREGGADLAVWIGFCLRRLKSGGSLTMIHRAERLPEILAALAGAAGAVHALPLQPRVGRPAKRVIVRAVKGARGPFTLAAPLILHAGAAHLADGEDFSDAAQRVLRDGAALGF